MVRSRSEGGDDFDGMWNDDFHHSAVVALTGRKDAYYGDYLGAPQEFISAAKYGFLYQGQIALVAKSVAWNCHFWDCSGGFCLFHRKPRSNRKHRAGTTVVLSNFTRTLPRYDCPPLARALDTVALSGPGVRRVQPIHVFR